MNDNNISVRITGDASGVAPAVDLAKGSIAGLGVAVEGVNVEMSGLSASIRTGMASAGAAAQEAAVAVTAAGERMGLAATTVKTHWEGLGAVMGKLNGIFLGVTAALAGGAVFKEAVHAATQLTSENLKLARALGVTLEKASGVHAAMHKLGIETDTVVTASQKMVRQLKAHEDSFNKIGIVTRDANGHFRDTLDIMTTGLGKLGEYRAGVDRTALAQMMFGRGAGDVTQLMRLNNAEIAEGARVAKELGLVTTNDGVTAMRAYKASVAEVSEVFEAFKVAVGSAMLPVLTELSEWFRSTGTSAVQGFIRQMSGLAKAILDVVRSGQLIFAWMNQFRVHLNALDEYVAMFQEALHTQFVMIGKIIRDAFMLNWGAIEADWNDGMAKIDAIATSHARHIAEEMGAAQRAVDLANRALNAVDQPAHLGGGHSRQDANKYGNPDTVDGLRADDIKGGKSAKGKKASAGKDDLVQHLDAELEAKKTAWALEQDAQGTAQSYSLQSEAEYWAAVLRRTDLSAKDKTAIEKKWLAVRAQLKSEEIGLAIRAYRADLEAAGANWDKKVAILRQEQAFIARMYGAESKEARAAADAVKAAERDKAAAIRKLQAEVIKGEEAARQSSVDAAEAAASFEVQMGRETQGKLLQQEKGFENQRYAIAKDALLKQIELDKLDPSTDPAKLKQLYNQVEQLDRVHQNKLTQIDRQAALERSRIQRAAIGQIASGFASAIAQMATLQKGFAATVKSIWQTLQQTIASALESIIQGWLTRQLSALILGKAQATSAAAGEIGANAAVAASAAYASTAAIPIVGPGLAPAAAATAYGGAISWLGSLPPYAVGAWDISRDHAALIHKGEMIIPASLATGMRAMIQGAANSNAPMGSNGSTNHFHFHGPTNKAEMKKWFVENAHAVGAGVRHYVRQGGNISANR